MLLLFKLKTINPVIVLSQFEHISGGDLAKHRKGNVCNLVFKQSSIFGYFLVILRLHNTISEATFLVIWTLKRVFHLERPAFKGGLSW